jgi:hypothetical protein
MSIRGRQRQASAGTSQLRIPLGGMGRGTNLNIPGSQQ